jgi:hypothetical protein
MVEPQSIWGSTRVAAGFHVPAVPAQGRSAASDGQYWHAAERAPLDWLLPVAFRRGLPVLVIGRHRYPRSQEPD